MSKENIILRSQPITIMLRATWMLYTCIHNAWRLSFVELLKLIRVPDATLPANAKLIATASAMA